MNWKRAKTIIIIMFLLTDVFLAVVLVRTRLSVSRISEKTIAETCQILSSRGITIENELIPRKRVNNRSVVMQNEFDSPREAAERMLKDFKTETENAETNEYMFHSNEASLHIQNGTFIYAAKRGHEPYSKGNEPDDNTMEEKTEEYLSKLGFNKKQMRIVNSHWAEGIYHCRAVPVFEDLPIYGVSMVIHVDTQGIIKAEGSWFSPAEAEEYKNEPLLDITVILTDLIYRDDCKNMKITGLGNGFYVAPEYLQSREVSAVPVYIVTDSAGRELLFDGRIGSALEE